jgi:hypothetical protein
MNQFNNIGSMLPGPENRPLRENAKQALMLPGEPAITGLIITNKHGDVFLINTDKVAVLKAGEWHKLKLPAHDMTITALRAALDNMLVAEAKRHGGIPQLSVEELAFRETIAAYLEAWK